MEWENWVRKFISFLHESKTGKWKRSENSTLKLYSKIVPMYHIFKMYFTVVKTCHILFFYTYPNFSSENESWDRNF